jgi:hypothetical protein
MLKAFVLAKGFPVIAVKDEDGVLVQPELLVLIYEVPKEEVLVADAVLVAV